VRKREEGLTDLATQNMRDAHVVVVDDVCKVVGRGAISLDQNHIVLGVVLEGELTVD
jgi:hypothetical protein